MDTIKRTASLTLAAASGLVGLAGALAPSASAYEGDDHVHVSSTYYDTKSSCQSIADAYAKKVVAAGDAMDTEVDNNCKLETKGWTYNAHYTGDKVLSGDVAEQHSKAMEDALAKHGEEFTTYTHRGTNFETDEKAAATKAYNAALARLKAEDGKSIQLIQATAPYQYGEGSPWEFDITYAAKRHTPVFTGDDFSSDNATTKISTTGMVGSKLSSENVQFTTKLTSDELVDSFALGALAYRPA